MEKAIGKNLPRKEGRNKVQGKAIYVNDWRLPEMLYGVTVRSPIPRGKIKNIHFDSKIPWEEFTRVTAKDIPGANSVALIVNDQPYLASEVVNHPEEAIVLLAHPDKYFLEEARRHVAIEIEPWPAVFTIEESLAKKVIIWGEDNNIKTYQINKGDVDSVWEQAYKIIEGEYKTGAQEQLYIEPQGIIAKTGPEGVTVWGSMQCPYYVHKALGALLGLPADKIRVVQMETGGGFGGKEEYPSMIAGHAALLAWKSGRPVKMIYDRAEDMAATTKRHPSRTRIKTALDKEGKLLAQEIEFVIDGGAYTTLSPVVLSRGSIHALGPYFCPNIRLKAMAVATNAPPHGAFRGFGVPQTLFALERHMDRVAKAMGFSPEEFRRRNLIKEGQTLATGQVVRDNVDLTKLLDLACEQSGYFKKREKFRRQNGNGRYQKGMGLACFMHGAGFTGSGEVYLASKVAVEATAEGKVLVRTSSCEMGQGTNTIFAQIAADALELEVEQIEIVQPDTSRVPNSGPTVASRTAMVVGDLVGRACQTLKEMLQKEGLLSKKYNVAEFKQGCFLYIQRHGSLVATGEYEAPPGIQWDDKNFRGDAYATFAWAVYVAQVSVDTLTFQTTVEDIYTVQEVGRVLHPLLAAGQIEGGVAQGVGYALYEKVVWDQGRMINNQMTNYIMPTAADCPRIHVHFEEVPYRFGFSGAKGIGELPIDGPAPAILNAIEDATGVSVNHIPCMPEDLMEAFEKR